MEAAHTTALTSNNWKLVSSKPNVTIETMEFTRNDGTGKISKYTKISAIFPEKPEKLMKNFHDFSTFDKKSGNNKDARVYFPYFNTAELILKSSSGATVMELVRYIALSIRYHDCSCCMLLFIIGNCCILTLLYVSFPSFFHL